MRVWFSAILLLYFASVMMMNPSRVLDWFRILMRAGTAFSLELRGLPFVHPQDDPLPETARLRLAVRLAGVLLTLPAWAVVVTQALQ